MDLSHPGTKLRQHVVHAGLTAGLAITSALVVPATAQAASPKPHDPAATPMWAGCGHPAPPHYEGLIGHTVGNNVNLRRGSDTSCGSNGQAQASESLDYYCQTLGNGGFRWEYVRDLDTGVSGWIRGDLLDGGTGSAGCGF